MIYLDGLESVKSAAVVTHEYTLTIIKSGSGTVTPDVGTHEYKSGTIVMLGATPDTDNKFVKWVGEVDDKEATPTFITMDGDKTVTVKFAGAVTLTIISSLGGTTVPAPGVTTYSAGETVSIKAAVEDKFDFSGWSGDVISVNDTISVTMDSDKTIAATFTESKDDTDDKKKIYFATARGKIYWKVDGKWMFAATHNHGQMDGLSDDDHRHYLNVTRHDKTERHTLGSVVPHDSHANLTDMKTIGHTHAQIDTHINDIQGNPHQVTAAQTGALGINHGASLPEATADWRYQFFTVEGSAGPPAVADGLYWCRSLDGGTTFEWVSLS